MKSIIVTLILWGGYPALAQDVGADSGLDAGPPTTSTQAGPALPAAPVETPESPADRETIAERLNAIFDLVPSLRNVRATESRGVVTLSGQTLDVSDRERAGSIASKMDGVIVVDNQISQSVEIQERVAPAWDKTVAWANEFTSSLPLLGISLLIFIVFWWIAKFVRKHVPLRRLSQTPLSQEFAREAIRWLIVLFGLFVALETLGVASLVTALVGGAGILGVGLGFAFQDIIENYLAGILLGMRQPFRKNDFIRLDHYEGKVIRLTSRETVLMTLEGNHLSIPNAMIFKGVMYNYTRNPLRRFDFTIGVATDQSFAKVIEIGRKTLQGTTGVLEDPQCVILINNVGNYTLDVLFTGWVDTAKNDIFAVKSEAIRRVNRALIDAGIDMPEPMTRITKPPVARSAEPEPEYLVVDVSKDKTIDKQIELDRQGNDPNILQDPEEHE